MSNLLTNIKFFFHKKPVLVIVGKSCSGKNFVLHELETIFNYNRIVTATTRPIREGERQHRDYHFLSMSKFLIAYNKGKFLETKFFNTADGIWYYASYNKSYKPSVLRKVILLTPEGLKNLKENSIPHISFYLNVSDEEINRRQENRGDATKEERVRRFLSDKRDFTDIESEVDYVIDNEHFLPEETACRINDLYNTYAKGMMANKIK